MSLTPASDVHGSFPDVSPTPDADVHGSAEDQKVNYVIPHIEELKDHLKKYVS